MTRSRYQLLYCRCSGQLLSLLPLAFHQCLDWQRSSDLIAFLQPLVYVGDRVASSVSFTSCGMILQFLHRAGWICSFYIVPDAPVLSVNGLG